MKSRFTLPGLLVLTGFSFAAASAMAQAPDPQMELLSAHLFQSIFHCAMFGLLGIILVTVGFKLFDLVITKIDLEKEVAKGNVAASLLSAAAILAIGIIVASAIH